ncbi:MAG: hypothetical protein K2M65_02900, partial [Muribaculaceae bacterium]|nr:hypothetical protein [Muribaculaceae bacterium]
SGNIGTAGISCFYTPGSKFIECYNTGTIQAEKKPYCGGIVGHYKVITSMTPEATIFDGCYNTGNIIVTAGQGSGILAYCHKNVTVQNCYNTGNISGKSTLGGILSTMASDSKLLNCWNSGNVTTDAETAAGSVANNANHCLISGCFNAGSITSKSGRTAGGIAATCGSDLVDCVNFGKVKGQLEVGGLVGATVKGKTTFSRCYNAAPVDAPDNACGGLIGISTENTGYWDATNTVTDSYYVTGFNNFSVPQAGTSISMADVVKLDLGDSWTRIADNCMPVMKQYAENDAAKVNSAAVIPSSKESYDQISSNLTLGIPSGITWESSSSLVTIDGAMANTVTPDTPSEMTLTASLGKFTRVWNLTVCPKGSSSVNDTFAAESKIVNRNYFTTAGQIVAAPSAPDGRIYIIQETNAEGKTSYRKIINR